MVHVPFPSPYWIVCADKYIAVSSRVQWSSSWAMSRNYCFASLSPTSDSHSLSALSSMMFPELWEEGMTKISYFWMSMPRNYSVYFDKETSWRGLRAAVIQVHRDMSYEGRLILWVSRMIVVFWPLGPMSFSPGVLGHICIVSVMWFFFFKLVSRP